MFNQLKVSLFMSITLLLSFSSAAFSFSNTTCAPANLTGTSFAAPTLNYDFHMKVGLNPTIAVGAGPWGNRNWISFTGGSFCTKWRNGTSGTVAPSGQDANVAPLSNANNGTWLDTNYLLTTDDEVPAHLLIRTSGWQVGALWRLYIKIETGDERYLFLNTRMWVGALTGFDSAADGSTAIEYDAYQIL